jgi:hypothetical protein
LDFAKEEKKKRCIALLQKPPSLEYACMRRAVILGLDTSKLYLAAQEFLKEEFNYPDE